MKKITLLLVVVISLSSCFNNYFKVTTETSLKEDQLKQLSESDKKIIVHFRNAMKLLTNPAFSADQIKNLLFRDGQSYGFHVVDSSGESQIQMKCARKQWDKKAVLVARMKNLTWGGYIANELKRTNEPSRAMAAGYLSSAESTSMKVFLMTKQGWKLVDHFPPAGNTANRDLAMEIDLSEVDGSNVILEMEAPYQQPQRFSAPASLHK
ncbi:MAG TPA: hypothetical protein VLA58_03250, partial [Chitinophagaceae bacterium]|nr:hypothetical protein [Chitinophagaceae bacterium]